MVEVFPVSAYNDGTGAVSGQAIAKYEYSLAGNDVLTTREWSGGDSWGGDPTVMKVFTVSEVSTVSGDGETFSVESNGMKEVITTILGHDDSLAINSSTDLRKLFKTVERSVFDGTKCISKVFEEFRFIPIKQILRPTPVGEVSLPPAVLGNCQR